MTERISRRAPFEAATAALSAPGRTLYALAIAGLGVETLVCARRVDHSLGAQYAVLPVLPWLPAVPLVADLFGAIWVACAAGLLSGRTLRTAATTLGGLLFVCALILDGPKNAVNIGSIWLRTTAFKPLALASIAWLLLGWDAKPRLLTRVRRYVLGLSLVVVGVDHFLVLAFIANIIPGWIPWHVFWVAFFAVALIASGIPSPPASARRSTS